MSELHCNWIDPASFKVRITGHESLTVVGSRCSHWKPNFGNFTMWFSKQQRIKQKKRQKQKNYCTKERDARLHFPSNQYYYTFLAKIGTRLYFLMNLAFISTLLSYCREQPAIFTLLRWPCVNSFTYVETNSMHLSIVTFCACFSYIKTEWLVFRLLWEKVLCMGLDYCNLNKAFAGRWETMSTLSKAEISRPQWFPKQFLN